MRQGGPDGRGGDGRVQEGQMVLAGGIGVAGGWHGAGVQDGRHPKARSGGRVLEQDGGDGALGMQYQTGMDFQSGVGFQTRSGVPVIGWDTRHRWGSKRGWWVPDRDGWVPDR